MVLIYDVIFFGIQDSFDWLDINWRQLPLKQNGRGWENMLTGFKPNK